MTVVTDEALTVPEVMVKLKISRWKVYDLIHSRQLVSFTVGRSRRIPADGLRAYMAVRIESEAL